MILIRVDNMSAINTKAEMCGEADELPRCPQLLSSADPRAPHLVPPCTGPCMPPSPDALLFASTALGTAEKSQSTQCVCGGGGGWFPQPDCISLPPPQESQPTSHPLNPAAAIGGDGCTEGAEAPWVS